MNNEIKPHEIDDSIITLNGYKNEPFTTDFLDRFKLKCSNIGPKMHECIKKAIMDPNKRPNASDLMDYLDELKMYGKQYIFLFTLKGSQKKYLKELQDPEYVKNELNQKGYGDLYNSKRYEYESREPFLAQLQHKFSEEKGEMIFKWIQTRKFHTNQVQPDFERAANFFLIDLKNGNAELRIQTLQNYPEHKINAELERYKKLINSFIEFDRFTPVYLEPIIRHFIKTPPIIRRNWEINSEKEMNLGGKFSTAFLFKHDFPFKQFFSRFVTLSWQCPQESNGNKGLYFKLNGDRDSIHFGAISDKVKVEFILNRIREMSTNIIQIKELRRLVKAFPEYARIISRIDFSFSHYKLLQVNAKELSKNVKFPVNEVKAVFELITRKYPKRFFSEGEKNDTLSFRYRFKIRDGIRGYGKRKAEKSKLREFINDTVTPVLALMYGVFYLLGDGAVEWVKDAILGKILIGIPFFVVKAFLLIIFALLLFGSDLFFRILPTKVYDKLVKWFFPGSGKKMGQQFDGTYRAWLIREHKIDKTFFP
jgi:hypothetical protein